MADQEKRGIRFSAKDMEAILRGNRRQVEASERSGQPIDISVPIATDTLRVEIVGLRESRFLLPRPSKDNVFL